MAQSGSQEGPLLSGVALRYASALFELARESNAVDAVAGDLAHFDQLVRGSEDLQRLISNPIFTADEQSRAVGAILDKAGISRLQPYVTASNLLTFTKYSGMDPEVNQWGNSGAVQGIDWGTYPHSRTFVFGVNLEF